MGIQNNLYNPATGIKYPDLPSIITDGVDWSADFYENANIAYYVTSDLDDNKYWIDLEPYEWWAQYGTQRVEIELRMKEILNEYADADAYSDIRHAIDKIIAPYSTIKKFVMHGPCDLQDEYMYQSERLDILEKIVVLNYISSSMT